MNTTTTKDPLFYIKTGELTAYGYACGYVDREETETAWKEIYMEHQHYHVRSGPMGGKWTIWETFEHFRLTEARKLYRRIKI